MTELSPERRAELKENATAWASDPVFGGLAKIELELLAEIDRLATEKANLKSLLAECRDYMSSIRADMILRPPTRTLVGKLTAAIAPIALPPGDRLPRLDEAETKEKP